MKLIEIRVARCTLCREKQESLVIRRLFVQVAICQSCLSRVFRQFTKEV